MFGENNGSEERAPNHKLHPSTYGPGLHKYFTNYPTTEPSNCIVKVAGTLGADGDQDADYTEKTLPKNILTIVSYKTQLNHYIPILAEQAFTWVGYQKFDTTDALVRVTDHPLPGNTGKVLNGYGGSSPYPGTTYQDILDAWSTRFNTAVAGSFQAYTQTTDYTDKENPPPAGYVPQTLYPRWTNEEPWSRIGETNPAIELVFQPDGTTYFQTRDGTDTTEPALQNGVEYITPYRVAYSKVTSLYYGQLLNSFDYSFKFTKDAVYSNGLTAYAISHPWQPASNPDESKYNVLADECTWQYEQDEYGEIANKYPAGGYRWGFVDINPNPQSDGLSYVNYEATTTAGLFLNADGSCWNLGTTLKVKVYVWKTKPKECFFPNNHKEEPYKDEHSYFYSNWKAGYSGRDRKEYYICNAFGPYYNNRTRLSGPIIGRGEEEIEGFETGVPTGVNYSMAEPLPTNCHYWGAIFTPDFDNAEEHSVLEFTVTLSDTNTYKCDGSERPNVNYTPLGFKLEDIELEAIEGYITYIKDFEVTEVTKPGG